VNLAELRTIVTSDMPYDTGFMFLSGARFIENNHFMMAIYDIERVPYIVYNEMGTIFSTKNQYFIRDKTIGDINQRLLDESFGIKKPITRFEDTVKRRASTNMIKKGALEKIGGEIYAGNI